MCQLKRSNASDKKELLFYLVVYQNAKLKIKLTR